MEDSKPSPAAKDGKGEGKEKKKAQVMQRVRMDAEICRDVEGT